jgi:hypothetical protein
MSQAEQRENFIRNICGYDPEGKTHQVLTIKIGSRAEWEKLGLETNRRISIKQYSYIQQILGDLDQGIADRELCVSLLRQRNTERGFKTTVWYNCVYIIHTSPHQDSVDGHLVDSLYTSADKEFHVIEELFDQNSNAMIEEWTETHMLHLLAKHEDACFLIDKYFTFLAFVSMRFIRESGVLVPLPEPPRKSLQFP